MSNMLKKSLLAVAGVVIAGYLGMSGYAYLHDTAYASKAAEGPVSSAQAGSIRNVLNRNACYYCHSTKAELPSYSTWPGIAQLSKHDVEKGLRHFRIDALYNALEDGTPAPEADIAKLETVVKDGTMPPAAFRAVHWSTGLTQDDRDMLLEWIADVRKANYATHGVSDEFANEPVQPLPASLPVDARKVALGMRLFHDPRLSSDNSISCASCHGLGTGGVDNRKLSLGVGGQLGGVNAPTVFNAALNHAQFWDGRAATLQDQAGGPPLNPVEMASVSWDQIIGKLNKDAEFTRAFTSVYERGWSGDDITDAIAEFEKTLLTPSRFDAYLRGDKTALNEQELRGYQLFKANRCATCHVGANLGGQSYERMGLAGDYFAARGVALTDADKGRANVTRDPGDLHRFKVPGLRNVALTAPYFHDGNVNDLNQAVRDMAKYEVGTKLSEADVESIVAFLKALTGTYTPLAASTQ
ncbi:MULTISPECIES: cytochrome c peroxidase [unclassified Caballeronia]|uniref:cytochrome c peroxidase n=1 Tax=unclassified Caballeronia TaxID=2646786 RepID=UPI00202808DB|nr:MULTISPECIES: cytochrome c peroxidase [unclassified Caballeronia]MDR5768925.1 cytochrome c peroxidase [Caballeronia sp. LZ028]